MENVVKTDAIVVMVLFQTIQDNAWILTNAMFLDSALKYA